MGVMRQSGACGLGVPGALGRKRRELAWKGMESDKSVVDQIRVRAKRDRNRIVEGQAREF
jgi:hypothetical protein